MEDKYMLNLVAFCILMEGGGGILSKSPDYIMEKYQRYVDSNRLDEHQFGLDINNSTKLKEWEAKWLTRNSK